MMTATPIWLLAEGGREVFTTRLKPGEAVKIGAEITVRCSAAEGRKAWLQVDAPRNVPILRIGEDVQPPDWPPEA
nr:carbon storage regulator [Cereibacter sphaeroides f. sp. denitrificans]